MNRGRQTIKYKKTQRTNNLFFLLAKKKLKRSSALQDFWCYMMVLENSGYAIRAGDLRMGLGGQVCRGVGEWCGGPVCKGEVMYSHRRSFLKSSLSLS